MHMTAEGKALKEAYQWEAKAQWRGAPLSSPLSVSVEFYFKTKRKFDLDNANKLWQDALNDIAYHDDSQIEELHLFRRYEPANPRIEIALTQVTVSLGTNKPL